ncbi:hypothetical protein BC936DRAFT_137882 [Jimgerdemannia flammicorona]|uniref:Succinate dehydrogenase [ubiquinone] cytochrome b small subunit n=1 Tax=Jimgerdemannia flammicorona TaxID=994334 RepID=A0A433CWG4_9FUNG|nr:hypothetical protein BC936DRAFT_137882 [Jimgerdemannia flammicorona]
MSLMVTWGIRVMSQYLSGSDGWTSRARNQEQTIDISPLSTTSREIQKIIPETMALRLAASRATALTALRQPTGTILFHSGRVASIQATKPSQTEAVRIHPTKRTEGSLHWDFERAVSLALVPLTAAQFIQGASPVTDFALGVVLPLHIHIGMDAVITGVQSDRKGWRLEWWCDYEKIGSVSQGLRSDGLGRGFEIILFSRTLLEQNYRQLALITFLIRHDTNPPFVYFLDYSRQTTSPPANPPASTPSPPGACASPPWVFSSAAIPSTPRMWA